ncbi:MAG: glycosyltransferase family 2 protein [Culturomica sp.]|jgi:cellulose synthase/poly-beta-1,6-N-acetylglucosamine synthase-like glycosyltransferase|nr:glycosyltransferase family 2 protein [Culturomica sp.]
MFFVELWDDFFTLLENYSWSKIVSVFWLFFLLELPRYYLLETGVIVYLKMRRKHFRQKDLWARKRFLTEKPFVSVIAPGKNEGKNIYKLVKSLSEQTYKNFELIIVDDGSDDDTKLICKDFEKQGLIHVFLRNEVSGGKASAANFALQFAKGDYIIHLDADSSLDHDAIENILIPFYLDENIKGVGGNVKVRNSKDSLCTSFQALEYLGDIMVGRMVTSTLGIYRIISGAFGAFEAKTLKEVGAWNVGPGLDGDVTQKIRNAGYKIHFAHKAVCLTAVPQTFYALSRQRLRWSKSLVRFRVRRHIRSILPHRAFKWSNFFSIFENIFFYLFLDILWVIYMFVLILNNSGILFDLFVLKFTIMTVCNLFSFFLVLWVTERKKEEFPLIAFVPFLSIYVGYFLRIVRTWAYIIEFFLFSSYKDPWNPKKVSDIARLEN